MFREGRSKVRVFGVFDGLACPRAHCFAIPVGWLYRFASQPLQIHRILFRRTSIVILLFIILVLLVYSTALAPYSELYNRSRDSKETLPEHTTEDTTEHTPEQVEKHTPKRTPAFLIPSSDFPPPPDRWPNPLYPAVPESAFAEGRIVPKVVHYIYLTHATEGGEIEGEFSGMAQRTCAIGRLTHALF
jgi:hypothetical protein